jgi:hypothetical protein
MTTNQPICSSSVNIPEYVGSLGLYLSTGSGEFLALTCHHCLFHKCSKAYSFKNNSQRCLKVVQPADFEFTELYKDIQSIIAFGKHRQESRGLSPNEADEYKASKSTKEFLDSFDVEDGRVFGHILSSPSLSSQPNQWYMAPKVSVFNALQSPVKQWIEPL